MKVNVFLYSFLMIFSFFGFSQEMPVIKVGDKKIEVKKLTVKTEIVGDIAIKLLICIFTIQRIEFWKANYLFL